MTPSEIAAALAASRDAGFVALAALVRAYFVAVDAEGDDEAWLGTADALRAAVGVGSPALGALDAMLRDVGRLLRPDSAPTAADVLVDRWNQIADAVAIAEDRGDDDHAPVRVMS